MAMDMEVDAYAYALRASTPRQCPLRASTPKQCPLRASTPRQCPLRASTPKQCPLVTYKHVTITAPHKLPTVGVRVTACASKKEGGNKGGGNKEGTREEGEKGRRGEGMQTRRMCACVRESE